MPKLLSYKGTRIVHQQSSLRPLLSEVEDHLFSDHYPSHNNEYRVVKIELTGIPEPYDQPLLINQKFLNKRLTGYQSVIQIFLLLAIAGNALHFFYKIGSEEDPNTDIYMLVKVALVLMLIFNLPIKLLFAKLTVTSAVIDSLVNSFVYAYVMFVALVFCDSFNLTAQQDRKHFYTRKIVISIGMFAVASLRSYAD